MTLVLIQKFIILFSVSNMVQIPPKYQKGESAAK
jgi:hypothetical protein